MVRKFSGHESFQCRHLWLKKGYDFIKKRKTFNQEDAVVTLGVGKNMVNSIQFWMKAFNLLTSDDKLTEFANRLLSDDGFDPYIEDEATLWLLHYQLIKNNYASTYSLIFNEFRREKIEFTKENYLNFLRRKSELEKFSINAKTIQEDFSVFIKMYLRSDMHSKDKEESFSGLLTELDLVKCYSKDKDDFYIIENTDRTEVPDEIFLYAVLENEDFESSINLTSVEMNSNSAGTVFAMNRAGLLSKIENLTQKYNYIVYKDQAGVKEIQFKKKPTPISILEKYYAS